MCGLIAGYAVGDALLIVTWKETRMFTISNNDGQDTVDYIKSVLRYPLFTDNDQNNEFEVRQVEGGFVFIPIYPITFVIDESFYNRLFSILNLALTPVYTLIRPLTMQVVTLDGQESSSSRGLFLPARKGKPQRLTGTMRELINKGKITGEIPLMDIMGWNYVRSPHAIITGVSGSGKSYFLRVLYQVCASIGAVIAIDPKGSDIARLAKQNSFRVVVPPFLAEKSSTGISGKFLKDVVSTLQEVEMMMYARQGELYRVTSKISTDYRELGLTPIFVFIDELAALLTGANKQVKTDFQEILTRLIVLGREAGVYLVLSMQSARAEYLPTIVRDSISLRVQLGRINSENTRFLFPELNEMPMVPIGGKGSGIMSIAGDSRYAGIEPILTPTVLD